MNHCINGTMRKNLAQQCLIADVALEKGRPRSGNLLDPIQHIAPTVGKIVDDAGFMSGRQQGNTGV